MPTPEERLSILEYDLKRFESETIKAYSEMAMEFIMLKGLTEDGVKRLASLRRHVEERFDKIDRRFDQVDQRLNGVDKRLDQVDGRLKGLETTLGEHTTLLNQILACLSEKA